MGKLSSIWLATGIALFIWFVVKLWQVGHNSYFGVNSGAFKATLIAAGFSFQFIIGALGLMLKKTWGKIIITGVAGLTVLYLLTGGLFDGGIVYAIIVTGLSLLSIITIVMVLKGDSEL